MAAPWDSHAIDYQSSTWLKDLCETPFLERQFKRFGEELGGADWKAMDVGCGMGKYTTRLLQAGASYVLALDVSKNMVEGAHKETDKLLNTQANLRGKADFVVGSATELSSIHEAHKGPFDLAICIYVFCNLLSAAEVKQALAETFKMLKPGGKLFIYEAHVLKYVPWDNTESSYLYVKPKEDGTKWNYFEDEGKPREVKMTMNSGQEIKFVNRLYTLSSWVSWIVEAGFHITQLLEPHLDPKAIPADAPDSAKSSVGQAMGMCWKCTKPLPHLTR